MQVKDLLWGCTPGQIQTAGLMSVIPLTTAEDLTDERFVSPVEARVSTTNYGTLVFENTSDAVMIVPLNAGYVAKTQRAQDHAMATAGVVSGKAQKSYSNAMCIQSNQGGYLRPDDQRFILLPWALREEALQVRRQRQYNKIWDALNRFNREMGLGNTRAHMEDFLDRFERQLDEFVAEFEIVPDQTGVIILINGAVFGVERTPSPAYFRSIFKQLVREAYGSVAIQIGQGMDLVDTAEYKTRTPLPPAVSSLAELEEALSTANAAQDEQARVIVRDVLGASLEVDGSVDDVEASYQVKTLTGQQFQGQMVQDGQKIHYASLFIRKEWLENQAWYKAREFNI